MPNRILKNSICSSDTIDSLSWFQEVVFYRLLVNCDDYGRMDARPKLLKSMLFPLKDRLSSKDVEDAVQRLADVGCVRLYEVEGKPYLYLPTWGSHQNIRAKKSKYPEPEKEIPTASYCNSTNVNENIRNQMNTDESKCPRNPIQSNPIQSEYESEYKSETAVRPPSSSEKIDYNFIFELFNRICKSYPKITAYSEARKKAIRERFKSGYTVDDFKTVFEKAENSDFLKGKNNRNWSANFDWLIKDENIAKVLDGNYDDKSSNQQKEYSFNIDEYTAFMNDFGDEENE